MHTSVPCGRQHFRAPFHPVTALALLSLIFAPVARTQAAAVQTGKVATGTRLIVLYRSGSIPGDAEVRAEHAGGHLVKRHERFGTAVIDGNAAAEQQLRNDPAVEYVVPDRSISATTMLRVQALNQPNVTSHGKSLRASTPKVLMPVSLPPVTPPADTYYNGSPQGWAVRAVGGYGGGVAGSTAAGPWSTTTGKGVRIAILDSGVDAHHPDIAPNLLTNLSEVDQTVMPSACDDGTPQDQTGHGTWVASLAAAAAGNTTGEVVGVAPDASLLNIKVMQRMPGTGTTVAQQCAAGQASGMLSWVLQGIDDAVSQQADVIVLSMSLTLDLYNSADAGTKASFDRVTHAAAAAGAVLVAAAGNDAFDLTNPRYVAVPAQSRDVLAVVASTNPACAEDLTAGATCAAGAVTTAYYSNIGAPLNAVGAPGGSYPEGSDTAVSGWVRGACTGGLVNTADGPPSDSNHSEGCFDLGHAQYVQAIGTSASAPLVAGVAALVRAAHPGWSVATVQAALRASATQTLAMSSGVVNASIALAYQP